MGLVPPCPDRRFYRELTGEPVRTTPDRLHDILDFEDASLVPAQMTVRRCSYAPTESSSSARNGAAMGVTDSLLLGKDTALGRLRTLAFESTPGSQLSRSVSCERIATHQTARYSGATGGLSATKRLKPVNLHSLDLTPHNAWPRALTIDRAMMVNAMTPVIGQRILNSRYTIFYEVGDIMILACEMDGGSSSASSVGSGEKRQIVI